METTNAAGPDVAGEQNQSVGDVPTGHATAALVLGIISIFLPFLGLITGIVAIAIGTGTRHATLRSPDRKLATAGWVLGIIAVVIWGVALIVCTVFLSWILPVHNLIGTGVDGPIVWIH